ncbi:MULTISPECIES: ABC transporter ATP-binding protein [unclassified Arcicella]|uniref:ABC transporter ATP-binding protein n=1 Tax=unclassified Arcicella TaxID=2644986 RepID=UPI00285CEE27|nr:MULTISPECIES: ABC transporter ATP-binding protein [unclassified Arcicella]MDR6563317.1 ATP-binding cassette subfamily B protein [Arcicella sp. BE51]MDR6813262.1 ATP-binding cassette subfamily B protein [Arcicella sp. BE140]MDR6824576.1 ATP-binding cassette subfamily B protein [Arcicella sp. BE139]
MRILYRYLKKYQATVLGALALAAINQIFSLLDPFIFRKIIDDVATVYNSDNHTVQEFLYAILPLSGASVGVAFVSRVAKNFQDYFISTVTQRVGAQIYADGISHSLELPYESFEDQRSGETLGKLQKVRVDVEKLISVGINILFQSVIALIFISIYAFSVHWMILPLFLVTGPLIAWISSVLSKKIKTIQIQIVRESTGLAGSTTESLRNIELVKSLGLAKQEVAQLNATTQKILALELKKVRYVRSMSFVQGTCVNLIRALMVLVLIYLIYEKKITIGEFYSLNIYSFFLFGPLQEIGNVVNTYREAEVSLQNFEDIFKIPVEVKPANPYPVISIDTLAFEDVQFRHQSATKDALRKISFEAKKGETIAFVGPSGSGKSTLVKLLVGLYRPKDGKILFNGHNYNEIDFDQLRERIGFVTQDTQLFSGTIRENLLFVNPSATDEQCLDVLKKAACNTLLERADKGLDSVIGEGGVKVSGGEKQRLSIARALLRNPNLLVFDEATSSLDSLTEEEISETIREVSEGHTHLTIVIAHRLSTIMHADKIFVLEKGKIVENGSHTALLDNKGLYYAMWRQQVGEKDSIEID